MLRLIPKIIFGYLQEIIMELQNGMVQLSKTSTPSNSGIISNSNFGIAVDQDNNLWTSSLQSFDGNIWASFSNGGCYKGGPRLVFIDDNQDTWVSGTVSVGIESGIVEQPCVYYFSDIASEVFHFEEDDNLPELEAFSGQHLIGQLSDGTIILVGKTANGIEIKNFNGTSWDDFNTFNSPEVGMSYWGLWIDENDNILLGGAKDNETSQIAKFCNGDWTFYDLPEADGFPPVIFDLMVDNQSRLWFTGNVGLGSVPYTPTTCQTTHTKSLVDNKICSSVNYHNGFLTLMDCQSNNVNGVSYQLFDAAGKSIHTGSINSSSQFIGQLNSGLYFIHLKQNKSNIQTLKLFVK